MKSAGRLSLIATACAAALSQPARAQQQNGAAASGLEEIVVSARRREENVQDVPISIVALERRVARAARRAAIVGHRPASAEHRADGRRRHGRNERQLPHARHPGHRDLRRRRLAVERRRPHDDERRRGGARRGAARPAGHVVRQEQHRRRDPIRDEAAGARSSARRSSCTGGEYDRRDVVASVDVPIADNLVAKLTGAQLYRDGFITSRTTGRKFGDIDDRLFRGDFLWTPSDDVTFRFIAESSDLDRNGSARTLEEIRLTNARPRAYNSAGYPFTNLTHVSGFPDGQVGEWETMSDVENDGYVSDLAARDRSTARCKSTTTSLFKTITGYRDIEDRVYTDWDAAEITLIEDDRWRENDQLTQEFQIQHTINDRISYVAGLVLLERVQRDAHVPLDVHGVSHGPAEPSGGVRGAAGVSRSRRATPTIYVGAETSGQAIFGEANFALTDKLELTVGRALQRRGDRELHHRAHRRAAARVAGHGTGRRRVRRHQADGRQRRTSARRRRVCRSPTTGATTSWSTRATRRVSAPAAST